MSERYDTSPAARAKPVKPPSRRDLLIGGIWNGFMGMIWTLFAGLFISIIIEWVGITFIWPDEGYRHSQEMFNTEVRYLRTDFRASLLVTSEAELTSYISQVNKVSYEYLFMRTGVADFLRALNRPPAPSDPWTIELGRWAQDYLLSLVFITQLYVVRLIIIVLSIPMFLLFIAYGFVKGLNQRAIRTWCGGRESGTRYHWGKYALIGLFSIPFLIYLAYPDTIHPSVVLVPSGACIAWLVYYVVSNYKKHL